LRGKSITEFSSPAILGTDKANHDRARLIETIDKYIADVGKANTLAIKRFAKDGRDADGNPLFPVDRAMAGERFAQMRMRILAASEAQNWSPDDLQYAINEVFARHGGRFEDKKIAALFTKLSWYRPRADLSNQQIEESLSDVEMQNVMMLHSVMVTRKRNADLARQAALDRQQQQEADRLRIEAEKQAQIEGAVLSILGGVIQGVINHR